MVGSNDSLIWPGPPRVPGGKDNLRPELQALAEFIQNLKQHAERSLGHLGSEQNEQAQSEQDQTEEYQNYLRGVSARWEEASARWEKEKEGYDRRWKESQARWEEMQRDIERRLDALEGRSSEGGFGEEGTEREGPRDG